MLIKMMTICSLLVVVLMVMMMMHFRSFPNLQYPAVNYCSMKSVLLQKATYTVVCIDS